MAALDIIVRNPSAKALMFGAVTIPPPAAHVPIQSWIITAGLPNAAASAIVSGKPSVFYGNATNAHSANGLTRSAKPMRRTLGCGLKLGLPLP